VETLEIEILPAEQPMKSWGRRLRTAAIAALAFGFAIASAASGQEREDERKNRGDQPMKRRTLQLVDGAADRTGGANVTIRGKVRTTTLVDRGRDVKIVEDPNRGIVIEVTQHFGAAQMQQLKNQHPELRDYIDLFPTETGDHEIELNISLKKKFEAPDAKRLKVKSLFAFGIYRRHVEQNGDHLAKLQQ
jgi:hypothetical protein